MDKSRYTNVRKAVPERESVRVLHECIELQLRKGQDYQAEESSVRQADYYPRGVWSIWDPINAKVLRIKSLLEKYEANDGSPNYESIEDSAKDLINYASFLVSYARGKMDGQRADRDILNRPLMPEKTKGEG